MEYADGCLGCRFSREIERPPGGIAKLEGDWTVNQYGGEEGYLGWLALQPRYHGKEISELKADELRSLGPNIKTLDRILTQYWHVQFPNDPVRRVYVVYLYETGLLKETASGFHLHIHVIPRLESLGHPGALFRSTGSVDWVDGWQIPLLRGAGADS